ncbi:hypothetical protein AB1Y20_019189 [Prymnesium parvum]|uniref:UBX domain-containing protein n=1 Tax=Prymnesium parvum TaxID=97485 RepID=A0AB34JQP5_PRYPA
MAMRLQVDVGGGKKEVMSVGPNTTMQAVLVEMCQRRRLDPSRYALKHRRALLESSLTVRFSGLSPNAMLELVPSEHRAAAHGDCTIALQSEDGQRKTIRVDTATSLSQLLGEHAPPPPEGMRYGVVFTGRPIAPEALEATTVGELGVRPGGSAVLRLSLFTPQPTSVATPSLAPPSLPPSQVPPVPSEMPAVQSEVPPVPAVMPAVQLEVPAVQLEVPAVQFEVPAVQLEVPAVQSEVPAVTAEAPAVQSEVPAVQSEVPAVQSEVPAVQSEVPAVQSEVPAVQSEVPAVQSEVPAVQSEVPAVQSEGGASAMQMDSLPAAATPPAAEAAPPAAAAAAAEADGGARRAMISEAIDQLRVGLGAERCAEALGLLRRYAENVLAAPHEPKFRTIRQRNARFDAAVGAHAAARHLLRLVGFREERLALEAEEEPVWTLPAEAELEPLAALAQLARSVAAPPAAGAAAPQPAAEASAAGRGVAAGQRPPPAQGRKKTVTEAQVERLRAQKLLPRADVSVPRQLVVLRPGERPPAAEVDDDFFEVTQGDLHGMAISSDGEPAAMQTAAMRELAALQALKSYSHALVRVRLPNGLLLQAAFHPLETVGRVIELVASCLHEAHRRRFTLFTSPPRVTLNPEHSLVQAGLVPAATAILAWEAEYDARALTAEELLAPEALASLSAIDQVNTQLAFPTAEEPHGGGASTKRSLEVAQAPRAAAAPGQADTKKDKEKAISKLLRL